MLRRAGRRGRRRPGGGRPVRRLLGRLPHPARPGHAARAVGGRASPRCRWPTTSPPTRTRWRRCGPSTGRCSAARRRRCRDVYVRSSPLTYVDAGGRAGARAGRRERPALPDPADRQLPGRARPARRAARGVPVRRRARLARHRGDRSARSRSPCPSRYDTCGRDHRRVAADVGASDSHPPMITRRGAPRGARRSGRC